MNKHKVKCRMKCTMCVMQSEVHNECVCSLPANKQASTMNKHKVKCRMKCTMCVVHDEVHNECACSTCEQTNKQTSTKWSA